LLFGLHQALFTVQDSTVLRFLFTAI